MLSNPMFGDLVQVWYRPKVRDIMPLHGKFGRVNRRGSGRPRNHEVLIDGEVYVVPAGNLRRAGAEGERD